MRYFLSLFLLVLAFIVNARQITPDEAQAVAQDFFNNSSVEQSRAPRAIRARSLNTAQTEENAPYYIFNASDNNGFVIISGDDRAKKIIGYSDKGNFDVTNMPPQLSAMLDNFAQSLSELTGSTADQSWTAPTRAASSNDGVLLETANWGQGYPYNAQCPIINGVQCPTGCVATALAIVMKYHNWPYYGEGSYSYQLWGDTYSFDFESSDFNWSILKDEYSDLADEASNQEIAKLMSACGIGVSMGYTPNESGSHISFVKRLLIENLKYDSKVRIVWRNNFYPNEWYNIITSEIKSGRPIYLEGGDHAFVCDGFNEDKYFHINWGWGGEANGYFNFSNLTPINTNWLDLVALIGIEKRTGQRETLTQDVICKGEYRYDTTYSYDYLSLDFLHNYSVKDFQFEFGSEVFNEGNGTSEFFSEGVVRNIRGVQPSAPGVIISANGAGMLALLIDELPVGNYKIYPAYRQDGGEFKRIPCLAGAQGYISLSVTQDGEYIYSNPGSSSFPDIEIIKLQVCNQETSEPTAEVYAHEGAIPVYYTLLNKSDLPAKLVLNVCDEDDRTVYTELYAFPVIEPEQETSGACWLSPDLAPGNYHLKIQDFDGHVVCEQYTPFTAVRRDYDIEITDIKLTDYEYHYNSDVSISIKNNGDNYCIPFITMEIIEDGYNKRRITYPVGLSPNTEYTDVIFNANFAPGDIELNFYEPYGKKINNEPLKHHFKAFINWIGFEYYGLSLKLGESDYLLPVISPENADNKTLIWESSSPEIASVDQNGLVTALSIGNATITVAATDGSRITASCNVEVRPILAESLAIDPMTWSGEENTSFQIFATVLPENTTNKELEWTSSDESVATVDGTGLVRINKNGICTITVATKDGSGLSTECKLEVSAGIDEIFVDENSKVDVYNTVGVLLKKSCNSVDIKLLTPGLYILRSADKAKTILIK